MIKNIIFDLGGVILNIDFQRAADSFQKLGLQDFNGLYSQAEQVELFSRLEKGLISPEKFRNDLRKLIKLPISDKDIDSAWNDLILDFPPARLQLLKDLRKNYRLFLLSNTNSIHADFYNRNLRHTHQIDGLEDLFDKVYYSHDIALRKPDKEAFEYLLNAEQLKPQETLFIDDSYPNILTAKLLNMHTLYIDKAKAMEITDFFENAKLKSHE